MTRGGAEPGESAMHQPSGGGSVLSWRYVWPSPEVLRADAGG